MISPTQLVKRHYASRIEQEVSDIPTGHWDLRDVKGDGYNIYRFASRLESNRKVNDELALFEEQVVVNTGAGYVALRETMSAHDGAPISETVKCGHYSDLSLLALRKVALVVRSARDNVVIQ